MSTQLRLTHPAAMVEDESVKVGFGIAGDKLRIRFEVQTFEINVNPEMDRESPQWGLWDWDVVELFLGFRSASKAGCVGVPYYEFQVSPLGQYLELKINEPRVDTDREFRSGLTYGARILSDDPYDVRWEAWMEVPLKPLGWNGNPDDLIGGAFSILGSEGRKRYWSLFLPPQTKPDFHLPEHFGNLLKNEVPHAAR